MNLKNGALALTFSVLACLAQAQNASPIINSIKKSGEIVLGHGKGAIPFTYMIPGQNTPMGFAHDIELLVVEHLREKLNMPNLKIKYQLLDFGNATSLVSTAAVHLHCGTSANLIERQKDLTFSDAFFVATTRLLARKDSNAKSLSDMKGKKIASFNNSWAINFVRSKKSQFGLGDIRGYDNIEQVVNALNSGEVEAFFMGDAILAGAQMQLPNPDDWHIVGKAAGSQRYGCIMAKGDEEFKSLVDEALGAYYASGDIYKLYDKWFKEPIEPSNKSLNFEMSDATRQVFVVPTDKAIGQD